MSDQANPAETYRLFDAAAASTSASATETTDTSSGPTDATTVPAVAADTRYHGIGSALRHSGKLRIHATTHHPGETIENARQLPQRHAATSTTTSAAATATAPTPVKISAQEISTISSTPVLGKEKSL